jgi:2-hydroxy-3-keto-5-methylthiopentenyl-1-phosphate phosphatase
MSNTDFEKIFFKYKGYIKNWDYDNSKRVVICFAGVAASGKTVISKELEKIYKGIRINSIDVYNLFEEYRGKRYYDGFIQEKRSFIYWVMDRVYEQSPNKLIILDKNIDRTYEEVSQWCKEHDSKMIVVSLEASRDTLVKRLIEKEGENAKGYIHDLDRWIGEHEEFKRKYKGDISFNTDETSIKSLLDELVEYINY